MTDTHNKHNVSGIRAKYELQLKCSTPINLWLFYEQWLSLNKPKPSRKPSFSFDVSVSQAWQSGLKSNYIFELTSPPTPIHHAGFVGGRTPQEKREHRKKSADKIAKFLFVYNWKTFTCMYTANIICIYNEIYNMSRIVEHESNFWYTGQLLVHV